MSIEVDKCVDCKIDDRTVLLMQEAVFVGKRFQWWICARCWRADEKRWAERRSQESA